MSDDFLLVHSPDIAKDMVLQKLQRFLVQENASLSSLNYHSLEI